MPFGKVDEEEGRDSNHIFLPPVSYTLNQLVANQRSAPC